jgi:tetratricopeptide (TPR) repeat protein
VTLVWALAAALAAVPPPDDLEARLLAGRNALSARDYAAAKSAFTAALAADPRNATAHLSLGIIALVEGDAVEGLRHFSAVPGDVRALVGRLDCELRLRRIEDARKTAKQLDAVAAGNPAVSEHAGKLLANAGEYAAAAPFLRRASGPAAVNLLGMVEEKSGNLEAAVKAFARAAALEPANEDFRVDYAAVLLNSGDVEKSVAAFQSAATDFPASARVRLGLGSALYLAGQHEAAARALLDAVRLEPTARAFDLLGKAYEGAGSLQGNIRTEFEKYLRTKPSDAPAYAHYGAIVYSAGGRAEEARQALTRALNIDPNLAEAHLQLGIIEQAAGDWKAALARLQRAAKLQPENAAVRYRLANVYQKLGDSEKAGVERAEFQRLKSQEKSSAQP